MSKRADEKMFEIISKAAENGILPWDSRIIRKMSYLNTRSGITKKAYNGFNALITALFVHINNWDSNEFVTFNGMMELKGSMEKGTKGIPIFTPCESYYCVPEDKWLSKKQFREVCEELEKEGREEEIRKNYRRSLSFAPAIVYNLAQLKDIDYQKLPPREAQPSTGTKVEDLLDKWIDGPEIERTFYTTSPCFVPSKDLIKMLPKEMYGDNNGFEHALAHEMVHATGLKERLGRDLGGGFGSEKYSKEELVADIGANMILARLGFSDEELEKEALNSGAYVRGWSEELRKKKDLTSLLQSAYKQAQEAVDYIFSHQASAKAEINQDEEQEAV